MMRIVWQDHGWQDALIYRKLLWKDADLLKCCITNLWNKVSQLNTSGFIVKEPLLVV